jgi:hypothetical protein
LSLLGLAYPKTPTVEFVAVELFDSLCGSRLLGELDKAKPSCATGDAVERQNHLCHVAHVGKKFFQILLRRIVAQIPYKNFGANDDLLSSRLSTPSMPCSLTHSSQYAHLLAFFCHLVNFILKNGRSII